MSGPPQSVEKPKIGRPPRPIEDRLWERVDKGDGTGCWLWTGGTSGGRGVICRRIGGKSVPVHVHRLAYELQVGQIPDEACIDHSCGNLKCVNPEHLIPCTKKEIMASRDTPRVPARAVSDRLWERVDKSDGPDECWIWKGWLTNEGYGSMGVRQDGRPYIARLAHRIVYELEYGPIPKGMQIDHACRVRACCNPSHLRLATPKQNMENQVAHSGSETGVRGVSWSKARKKYVVSVCHNGKRLYGGGFDNLEEAEMAAVALRNELFTHNAQDRVEEANGG